MAKGKLKKTEKYIIDGMNKDGHSVEEISEELGRGLATIKKHLSVSKAREEESDENAILPLRAKDLIVSKTAEKSNSGVSIFTRAASERSDESKKQSGESRLAKDAIFRPLDN